MSVDELYQNHLDKSKEIAKNVKKMAHDQKASVYDVIFTLIPDCKSRAPDKCAYRKTIFFISHPKHMLWVLKRTLVSILRSLKSGRISLKINQGTFSSKIAFYNENTMFKTAKSLVLVVWVELLQLHNGHLDVL